MNIQSLTGFFMWCTLINAGLLVFSLLFFRFRGDFIYRMQGRFFPMTRETFNLGLYSIIGVYKILFFIFNLVPWVALQIIG